jgi:hypothetical protein
MSELVAPADVEQDFISYQENEETAYESSDDFASNSDDFEYEVRARINSSGEMERFQNNMSELASMVTAGQFTAKWITCESEDSRIDIHISTGKAMCKVHKWCIEDDDDEDI